MIYFDESDIVTSMEDILMIFIGGIHGVGKSFFCEHVRTVLFIETHSASGLIAKQKMSSFSSDKLIPDIDDNQQYLLTAINDLNSSGKQYLLDGHFCLLNGRGRVTRIPEETFYLLRPEAIVLLTEKPEIIAERRKQRDDRSFNLNELEKFQEEEITFASEIAKTLEIPLLVSSGVDDLDRTVDFLRENIGRKNDGG
ncbi:hypothetical protein DOZ58_04530 [Acetobacterium sp. KB-1]|nr:hypothetical protein DOZ58_04530 [Acetobacterium sp. KB-1]